MIAALLLVGLQPRWPTNMTVSLAGIDVTQRQPFDLCSFDRASGYFAYKTFECDGSHVSAMLTMDRRNVRDAWYDTARFGITRIDGAKPIGERKVSLQAGNGIAIGTGKEKALAMLGNPTLVVERGTQKEYWCALYKSVKMEDKETGMVLRNSYIFKKGLLVEMFINLDQIPGCGEDSLSDEGWPWTHF